MGAEYERVWPKCDCTERCNKSKCMHAGGTQLAKEAAALSIVGRKNSPERLTILLKKMMQVTGVVNACLFAGTTYSTLRYWLKRSQEGQIGDGFDLTFGEETKRFHEHYEDCRETMVQEVEDAYTERALHGYYETLHHQGRVAYQFDQELVDLGLTGPDAYLRDENNKPIPERIQHQDPEVMLAVLKAWRRDKYGQHDRLDVTHRGGVMVVTAPALSSADLEARELRMKARPIDVEFREIKSDESEGG